MGVLDLAILAIRAIQFIFAIIVIGLTGHVASYGLSPSQNNFMLFTGIWTCLVVLYVGLTPKFFPSIAHVFAILALDALTMLFWFAAFIALAVYRHQIAGFTVGDGFGDSFHVGACGYEGDFCGVIAAAAAFGGLEWLLFVFTTVFAAIEGMRQRSGKGSGAAPLTTA
ncbi:hypothetical protein MMC21_007973 [Puttea exsequens]|nr:hypothetical protein [Puttea exsequens]